MEQTLNFFKRRSTPKLLFIIIPFLIFLQIHTAVFADEQSDFDGYIVKLESRPQLQSDTRGIETYSFDVIVESEGLYLVEDNTLVEQLQREGSLVYSEPNYIIELDAITYDVSQSEEKQWYYQKLNMEYCLNYDIRGESIRIGIVDSGIFASHIDFANTTIIPGTNYCVSSDSELRYNTNDSYGHGTFISGLIGASNESANGMVGIAPDAELVPLKCFDGKNGSLANIISAIYGGVDTYHCNIMNLSFGMQNDSTALSEAISYAFDKGVILVSSVGNLGAEGSSGNDPLFFPAAYPQVIGVGSTESDDTISYFSCQNESVFLVAPGSNLRSLSYANVSEHVVGSGTSYATAFVTASAALALSIDQELTPVELMDFLKKSSKDLGSSGYDTIFGNGLLDIGSLLSKISDRLHGPEFIIGDVNGDGRVTTLDRICLARYLAKWEGYSEAELNLAAVDVNQDNKVTAIDRIIIARYLAKWDGYDTLPHKTD